MKCVSVFEKYNEYEKKIILLAIETMSGQDKVTLRKGYGQEYDGKGFLYAYEVPTFERIDRILAKRIKEISVFLSEGKKDEEILDYYHKKGTYSVLSVYKKPVINQTGFNKVKDSFVEYFPPSLQKIVEKIIPKFTQKDKEIIEYFYWGKNYDIQRKQEQNKEYQEKMEQLNLLISRIKVDALKYLKEKQCSKPVIKTPVSESKTEIENNQPVEVYKKDAVNQSEKNNKKTVSRKRNKGFLEYFDEKRQEKVLQIIKRFEVTNPNYYELINRKYSGDNYEIVNDIELNLEEKVTFNNIKIRIRQILEFTTEKYNEFIKGKASLAKGFLEYFDEKDQEKIIQIINKFKETNPNYYEVINKKYSGERYEIVNDVILSSDEKLVMRGAIAKIRKILEYSTDKYNKFINEKGRYSKSLLDYFDEKDHEKVLEIINKFKETNPKYYEVINKKYSGERYEIINDVVLTQKESNDLTWARRKITKMLEQEKQQFDKRSNKKIDKQPVENSKIKSNEIIIESINDILEFVPEVETDNILLNTIIKNRKCIFRMMNIDTIVDCYIDNLSYFESKDAAMIIRIIALYQPDKISKIIDSSYFKDKLQYLTLKEQEYIYLTLLSYTNKFLTPERIAEMLEVDKDVLDEYQVMSSHEEVNHLNILFKDI